MHQTTNERADDACFWLHMSKVFEIDLDFFVSNIITPLNNVDLARLPREAQAGAIRYNVACTSIRQAADW